MYTHRSTRYRLLPETRGKHQKLMQITGACIWVWNRMLTQNEQDYWYHEHLPWLVDAPSTTFFSLAKQFTKLRGRTDWLQELPFAPVRHVLKHQAEAWKRYFKGQGGRPRLKSKYQERSVTFPEPTHFKLFGDHIRLQKLGWYRVDRRGADPHAHCEARSVTIKRDCDKWYAVVLYRVPACEVEQTGDGKAIGVDMNVRQVATSDGAFYRLDQERMQRLEARKRRYQRKMARQVRGSNRRQVSKKRLGKVCGNIRNFRENWQHHVSKDIVSKAATVFIDDLKIGNMTRSAKGDAENPGKHVAQKSGLNRSIHETGWGDLGFKLDYKAGYLGRVGPRNTSITCCPCGYVDKNNRQTQAAFKCLACGHTDNADTNAALNILAFGIGATGRGGGEVARPVKRQEVATIT